MEFAFLIAGIFVGTLLALLLARILYSSKTNLSVNEIQNLQTELNALRINTKVSEEKLKLLSSELEKLVNQITEKENTILTLTSKFTAK